MSLRQILNTVRSAEAFRANTNEILAILSTPIIKNFQKSILCGEHYKDASAQLLDEIEAALDYLVMLNSEEVQNEVNRIRKNYVNPYRIIHGLIQRNISNLAEGKEAEFWDISVLQGFHLIGHLDGVLLAESSDNKILNYALFDINLLLAYVDEYSDCRYETQTLLQNAIVFINQNATAADNEIIKLLNDKAQILLFKIHYRLCHRAKTHERYSVVPDIDDKNTYYEFYKKAKNHNDVEEKDITLINSNARNIKDKNIDDVILGSIHSINRFYSRQIDNVVNSVNSAEANIKDNLNEYISLIDTIKHDQNEPYSLVCIRSTKNLLFNTLLRMEIEKHKKDSFLTIFSQLKDYACSESIIVKSQIVDDMIGKAYEVLKKTRFNHYFCFKLILQFLNDLIDQLSLNSDFIVLPKDRKDYNDSKIVKQKEKRVEQIVHWLEAYYWEILQLTKYHYKKLITHCVKPIYLSPIECTTKYEWSDGTQDSLYLRSSSILPNDFKKVENQLDYWETTMNAKVNTLLASFDLALNKSYIRYKIDQFDKKSKENEFKVVQIVALFVSIATFVLINVKIFDGKSGRESFGIILGLGACFFMFNLFFYFITIDQFSKIKSIPIFLGKSIVFLAVPITLAFISKGILNSENGKYIESIHRIDSIQKNTLQRMDDINKILKGNIAK